MKEKLLREWKKVFESDLSYICLELKELIKESSMLILEGAMGAGKTTFAKKFVKDGDTLSPSYSILSESESVLHADLYRLEHKNEILHLELPLYLEDKSYFLVEWGLEHISYLLKEIPEDFEVYILKIEVNSYAQKESEEKTSFSRNLSLFEVRNI